MTALRVAVVAAAKRAEVRTAVRALYAALGAEIVERRPRCDASGRCCRFAEFGHRLYVTTAELATFFEERSQGSGIEGSGEGKGRKGVKLPVVVGGAGGGGACPYQVDGLCSVHEIRPFGCRVFFCDPSVGSVESGGDGWMEAAYERYHGRIKALHEELGVPYMYVEWRAALAESGLGGDPL